MTLTNQELLTELDKVRSDQRGRLASREEPVERRKLEAITQVMTMLDIAIARQKGTA